MRQSYKRSSQVSIYADDLDVTLGHLVLERDVHYKASRRPGQRPGWGTVGNPIQLRAGESFVLGDNSPASQDSRFWSTEGDHLAVRGEAYQRGTVPEDQLIGRAFFVYWPAGLRTDLIPGLRNFGLIPNVGRMRWIR